MNATVAPEGHPVKFAAMLCLYINNDHLEVEAALKSAFHNQSLKPDHLIAVFDGPVHPEVARVIDDFEKEHSVTRVYHDACKGHGPSRSAAIDACEHDWIAIVDADDVSKPHRFEATCSIIKQYPDTAVVGGGITEFNTTETLTSFGKTKSYPESPADVRRYLKARSPIAQPASMLRVEAIKAVGNYMPWFNNEDYHLWIRLVSSGYELRNSPHSLIWFRTNPALFMRRGGWRYWLNETKLQFYSLRSGTTSLRYVVPGVALRFVIQVMSPNKIRKYFYENILR
ncbi:glycosyltransferase [Fretibacter rubidus]|uniref:glycosyltransferase n=1 Tax=Fretibacter rubidus TaxID=570162 RepID=UPI00352A38A2